MALSKQQQQDIEDSVAPYLTKLSQCSNKSQRLTTYQIMIADREITLKESSALSTWQIDKNPPPQPIFFSAVPIREFIQNPQKILGINDENTAEARAHITKIIKTRIKHLKKNGIQPEALSEPTDESIAATLSSMAVYMVATIASSIQTVGDTTNTVIDSDNPIIRQAINYGMRGLMGAVMKGVDNPYIEATAGVIGGAAGGALGLAIESVAPGYGKITNAAVDGAVSALYGNIRGKDGNITGDLRNITRPAGLMAMSGAIAAAFSNDADLSGLAISSASAYSNSTTNRATDALYGSIQRNFYNSIYKFMDGKAALDGRDFNKFIQSYLISAGVAKLSKQAINDINSAISTQLNSYISYQQTKPENIDQSELLSAAAKTTDINLLPPSTEKYVSFPASSTYEPYYPTDSLNYNHTFTTRRDDALPTSSSFGDKSLAHQNLHDLLSSGKPAITNNSDSTAVVALAAIAINAARKWIFRKPKPKSEPEENTKITPKTPSKDRGGRF